MTPQEKAQELIDKMSFETHKYNAKHCALIAVDEILKANPTKVTENAVWFKLNIEYWKEVKKEIEKL